MNNELLEPDLIKEKLVFKVGYRLVVFLRQRQKLMTI